MKSPPLSYRHHIGPQGRRLYKYYGPDTTCKVLETQRVRYSSPLKFNDPFDVQIRLTLQIDPVELAKRLSEQRTSIESLPSGFERYYRPEVPPLSDDEFRRLPNISWVTTSTPPSYDEAREYANRLNSTFHALWDERLPRLRVFCASESNDNLLMWAHYANNHKGCVFEFLTSSGRYPLSKAREVNYSKCPPTFFSEDEWIASFQWYGKLERDAIDYRLACTKSRHWKYEKEWRTYFIAPGSDTNGFNDVPIEPGELSALYFGCNADSGFVACAANRAIHLYPDVKIFLAEKRPDKYALGFHPMKRR